MTEDHLKETVESELCQDIRDLDQKLNGLCSTVRESKKNLASSCGFSSIQRPTIFSLSLTKNANPKFLHHIVIDNRKGILHVNRKKTQRLSQHSQKFFHCVWWNNERSWTREIQKEPSLQILVVTK